MKTREEQENAPAQEVQIGAEESAQQVEASVAVAHAKADEVVMVTDEELQSEMKENKAPEADPARLVASAGPDGSAAVMIEDDITDCEPLEEGKPEVEPMSEYVTRAELEQLLEAAYLRGKNEAVEAQIVADTNLRRKEQPMADDLAGLFVGRPSVWR